MTDDEAFELTLRWFGPSGGGGGGSGAVFWWPAPPVLTESDKALNRAIGVHLDQLEGKR